MPYNKIEDGRWLSQEELEDILAKAFIEAVNEALWEGGVPQAIKFKIAKYVKENPADDVLPETQRIFPFVSTSDVSVSRGEWERALGKIKADFLSKVPPFPREKYTDDFNAFFRNIDALGY